MNVAGSCDRCGLRHHWNAFCRAKYARCNKCQKFGHFARMCFNPGLTCTHPKSVNVELRQQRDRTRMTEFLRRKDAANLPFFGTHSADLKELRFNSALTSANNRATRKKELEIQRLKESVRIQDVFTGIATIDLNEANSTIVDLEQTIKQLEESMRIQDLFTDMATIGLKEANTTIVDREQTIKRLEESVRIQDLHIGIATKDLNEAHTTIDDLEQTTETLKAELKRAEIRAATAEKLATDIKNTMSEYQAMYDRLNKLLEAIKAETETNSSKYADQGQHNQHRPEPNDANEYCLKCGSRNDRHSRTNCRASSNKCHMCMKKGHFTVLCTTAILPKNDNPGHSTASGSQAIPRRSEPPIYD